MIQYEGVKEAAKGRTSPQYTLFCVMRLARAGRLSLVRCGYGYGLRGFLRIPFYTRSRFGVTVRIKRKAVRGCVDGGAQTGGRYIPRAGARSSFSGFTKMCIGKATHETGSVPQERATPHTFVQITKLSRPISHYD